MIPSEIERGAITAAVQLRPVSEAHAGGWLGDLIDLIAPQKYVRLGEVSIKFFKSENPGHRRVPDMTRQYPMGNYIVNNIDYLWRWDERPPGEVLKTGFPNNSIDYSYRIFGKRTFSASTDKDGADNYFSLLSYPMVEKKRVGVDYHLYKINVKNLPVVDLLSNNNEKFMEDVLNQIHSSYPYSKDYVNDYIRNYHGEELFLTREAQVPGGINASRVEYVQRQHIFTYE